jgi:hypothetical protein
MQIRQIYRRSKRNIKMRIAPTLAADVLSGSTFKDRERGSGIRKHKDPERVGHLADVGPGGRFRPEHLFTDSVGRNRCAKLLSGSFSWV